MVYACVLRVLCACGEKKIRFSVRILKNRKLWWITCWKCWLKNENEMKWDCVCATENEIQNQHDDDDDDDERIGWIAWSIFQHRTVWYPSFPFLFVIISPINSSLLFTCARVYTAKSSRFNGEEVVWLLSFSCERKISRCCELVVGKRRYQDKCVL